MRGIGVAVSVSTSTCVRVFLIRSLCATPNRCSSSITSRPRSLKRTSADSRRCVPTTTSSLPSASFLTVSICSALVWNRDSLPTLSGKPAKRSAIVRKCCSTSTVVGARMRGLLAALHAAEDRAQRDLGLAVADVAADQAIHRARRLHVAEHGVDRGGLIGRLVERERRLELAERVVGGREAMAGQRGALRVELEQLLGERADVARDLAARRLPGHAAELVEPRRVALGADVALDLAEPVDRQVQRAAVVLELERVDRVRDLRRRADRRRSRGALDREPLEALVAADAVALVDEVVAGGELRRSRRRRRAARPSRACACSARDGCAGRTRRRR